MRKQNKDQSKIQAFRCPKRGFLWNHIEQQTVLFSFIFLWEIIYSCSICASTGQIFFDRQRYSLFEECKGQNLVEEQIQRGTCALSVVLNMNKTGQVCV